MVSDYKNEVNTNKYLKPGIEVLIQRSDGRIHPATISDIRYSSRCVCVEWRERNETKGKEILLDVILDLNPLLRASSLGETALRTPSFTSTYNDVHSKSLSSQQLEQSPSDNASSDEYLPNQRGLYLPSRSDISSEPKLSDVYNRSCKENSTDHIQFRDNSEHIPRLLSIHSRRTIAKPSLQKSVSPIIDTNDITMDNDNKESFRLSREVSSRIDQKTDYIQEDQVKDTTKEKLNLRIKEKPIRSTSNRKGIINRSDKEKKPLKKNCSSTDNELKKKTNCLREIQRIAEKRQQRRLRQYQGNIVRHTTSNTNSNDRNGTANSEDNIATLSASNIVNDIPKRQTEFRYMIEQYRKELQIKTKNRMSDVFDLQSSFLDTDNSMSGWLTNTTMNNNSDRITVSVRKRPINSREKIRGELDIISIYSRDLCIVHSPKEKVDLTKYLDNHKFRFDYAFSENVSTYTVYKHSVKPLIDNVIKGSHSMCFAYGQTGSGKTFTMGGNIVNNRVDCSNGVYAYATKDLFQKLEKSYSGQFSLFCSFFEIYCGKVFDLFNRKKRLQVLEDQAGIIQVVDLKQEHVRNVDELMKLIHFGMTIRTSGTTSANENSSRSHAVFRIILKRNQTGLDYSRIYLIDLAGSERGRDTSNSDKNTMMEGAEINKSLLALKECIRALAVKADHIPFRGSMLTRVLRDSFIGTNSMISMIAMISPSGMNSEHTLNTLRYADRVKELVAHECTSEGDEEATLIASKQLKSDIYDEQKCYQNTSLVEQLSIQNSRDELFINDKRLSEDVESKLAKYSITDDDVIKPTVDRCLNRKDNLFNVDSTSSTRHNDTQNVTSIEFQNIRSQCMRMIDAFNDRCVAVFGKDLDYNAYKEFEQILASHIDELQQIMLQMKNLNCETKNVNSKYSNLSRTVQSKLTTKLTNQSLKVINEFRNNTGKYKSKRSITK